MATDSIALNGIEKQDRNALNISSEDNLHKGDFLSGPRAGVDAQPVQAAKSLDSSLPKLILLKEQTDPIAYKEQVEMVAGELAKFIGDANKSVDIAIYNFHLKDPKAEQLVVDALNDRAAHGVDVKLAYFQAEPKWTSAPRAVEASGNEGDAAGAPSPEFMAKLDPRITSHAVNLPGDLDANVATEGIHAGGHLMHNKYIVRDSGSPEAAVWTGSTNWTDDAFGSMENNVIQLKSQDLAAVYQQDFNQLWDNGNIAGTGQDLHRQVKVGDSNVTVAFSPGDGTYIDGEIARRIEAAQESVHISSMDISSKNILQALADKIDKGIPVDGIYDGPQMAVVTKQWNQNHAQANIDLWNKVKDHLVEKQSPRGLHDIMHNKTVEIDNSIVITGSHNFTASAQQNAENMLVVENPQIARQYADYISDLVVTYGGVKNN